MLRGMRDRVVLLTLAPLVLSLAGCAAAPEADVDDDPGTSAAFEAALAPGALRTRGGEPIVVVVETRDRSIAVTAELVRDPTRTDLHELRAPRVMADIDTSLLLQPAVSP